MFQRLPSLLFCIHSEYLDIINVDMMRSKEEVNKQQHNTSRYSSEHLIVRRGQEFQVKVIFNRPYKPNQDQFAVEFVIGEDSSWSLLGVSLLHSSNL